VENAIPKGTPAPYAIATPHYRLSDLLENDISPKNFTHDATEQGKRQMESQDIASLSIEVEQILKRHFPAADKTAISRAVRSAATKLSFSTAPEARSPDPRTVRFFSPQHSQGICFKAVTNRSIRFGGFSEPALGSQYSFQR
jgi:hypothetical protein